jgi:hypothetical protein
LIAIEALAGEFQRGVENRIETRERHLVGAEPAIGAAKMEQGIRHAFIARIVFEKALEDRGGFGELAFPTVHGREAEQC